MLWPLLPDINFVIHESNPLTSQTAFDQNNPGFFSHQREGYVHQVSNIPSGHIKAELLLILSIIVQNKLFNLYLTEKQA